MMITVLQSPIIQLYAITHQTSHHAEQKNIMMMMLTPTVMTLIALVQILFCQTSEPYWLAS